MIITHSFNILNVTKSLMSLNENHKLTITNINVSIETIVDQFQNYYVINVRAKFVNDVSVVTDNGIFD